VSALNLRGAGFAYDTDEVQRRERGAGQGVVGEGGRRVGTGNREEGTVTPNRDRW